MKTGAVIVAAGLSSRMGDFKPMMQLGAMSIISRIIANFQQADVFPIVVITGYLAEELEKHLAKLGVVCLRNPAYATTEMFDSARIGFSFIEGQCDRVFFTPADIPLFTYDTVNRLLARTEDVVKPVCEGQDGHPVLLKCSLLEKILAYKGEGGLRQAIAGSTDNVGLLAVADEGVLVDADTQADYRDLVSLHNKTLFRPVLDVSLMREGRLFDKNAAMLLHMVAYSGTVKEACEHIGISYSKGWKLLSSLEDNLGFALLERKPGGDAGGMSVLTAEGEDLLQRYEKYVEQIKKYANAIFYDYFAKPAAPAVNSNKPGAVSTPGVQVKRQMDFNAELPQVRTRKRTCLK